MKDRIPTYPNRIKLTPVSGQENVYDMERADEATTEGTPLNKATLLKDSTAKKWGLTAETAVPDDIFSKITMPIIKVTARGGTLTCTFEDGTACDSENVGNEWTFYAPLLGTYTISGTYGAFAESKEITVDSVKIFTETLDYYSDVFNNNSWETIIYAVENNSVPDTWTVGSIKYATTSNAFPLTIIGKSHDDTTDGSKAQLTLMLSDNIDSALYGKTSYNGTSEASNAGGFSASKLKTYYDTYETQITDSALKTVMEQLSPYIKDVNKICYNGTEMETISMKFFPLSCMERTGNSTTYPAEGTQYEYFSAGNTQTGYGWSRTADFSGTTKFFELSSSGVVSSTLSTQTRYAPCTFCL